MDSACSRFAPLSDSEDEDNDVQLHDTYAELPMGVEDNHEDKEEMIAPATRTRCLPIDSLKFIRFRRRRQVLSDSEDEDEQVEQADQVDPVADDEQDTWYIDERHHEVLHCCSLPSVSLLESSSGKLQSAKSQEMEQFEDAEVLQPGIAGILTFVRALLSARTAYTCLPLPLPLCKVI